MDIEILRLLKKQTEDFALMDPFNMRRYLGVPGYYALGAVKKSTEGTDIPVGFMICRLLEESIRIEWLAADRMVQMQGVGEEMLWAVCDAAAKSGYRYVEAVFKGFPDREELCEGWSDYFKERGFETEDSNGSAARLSISVLASREYFEGYKASKRFKALSSDEYVADKELCNMITDHLGSGELSPVSFNAHMIDKDLSFAITTGSSVNSGILIGTANGVLYPLALKCENETVIRAMLYTVLDAAVSKYPSDTEVDIETGSGKWDDLLDLIIPGQYYDVVRLRSDI